MPWTSVVAARLKNARLEVGLSQEKLAELVGVSTLSISKFETGRRLPKLDTLERIAVATGYPIGYFCDAYEAQHLPFLYWAVDGELRLRKLVGPLAGLLFGERQNVLG